MGFLTCGTDARDVIAGQNLIILTQAEDEVRVFIPFTALRLAVAAVQLHLDLTLAMALHDYNTNTTHQKRILPHTLSLKVRVCDELFNSLISLWSNL